MQAAGIGLDQLSGPVIERYLAERRVAGYREYRSSRALAPLLAYLAPLGVLPAPAEVRLGPVEELLVRYRDCLLVERGLTAETVRGYVDCVRPFVAGRLRGDVLDLVGMTAGDVTGFVLAACPGRAVGSAKLIVCALRSLLRWLHLTGVIPVSLAATVPSVAGRRLSGLPKGLEPGQLRSLLSACDRRTRTGRRDYAIMLPLARLGLRAGEVACLGLDDIDWRRGELTVVGKGDRAERLPLPAEVGAAIAAYLRRGRPGTAQGRNVFVRVHAPHRALTTGGVTMVVFDAAQRAGLGRMHAHRLRHTAATAMLRRQPAGRGGAGAATPLAVDHGDLRQGRPGRAGRAGPALAGHRPGRRRLDERLGRCVVTGSLREGLADYLALRRALGYRLARPEKLLGQFLDHLERAGEARITVAVALDWARLPAGGGSSWWAYRLSAVRGFATYLHALDPAHAVPAAELLPQRPHRASPYLYSDAEIAALIAATGSLRAPLRRTTFATLIGLLAVTGIRVGEAIALNNGDVDLAAGRLLVRHGKFGKTRELALHPTTVQALRGYQRLRERLAPQTGTPALLVSTAGTRLLYCNVHHTFHRLVGLAGLTPRSGSCRPRIHDLRHSFAVAAMLDAHTAGQDGQLRLTLLSTWLGHVHPASTYWYLSASPELMAVAGQRLEAHLATQPTGRS